MHNVRQIKQTHCHLFPPVEHDHDHLLLLHAEPCRVNWARTDLDYFTGNNNCFIRFYHNIPYSFFKKHLKWSSWYHIYLLCRVCVPAIEKRKLKIFTISFAYCIYPDFLDIQYQSRIFIFLGHILYCDVLWHAYGSSVFDVKLNTIYYLILKDHLIEARIEFKKNICVLSFNRLTSFDFYKSIHIKIFTF